MEKFYHAKVAEGRAERTLHQYRENFRYFTYFLDYKVINRNVDTITTDVICNYVVFMKNEPIQFEDHNYKENDCKKVGLSRSTKDLLEIIERIKGKNAGLKSVTETWLDTSSENPMNEFLLTVFSGLVQFKRSMIKQQ